MAKKYSIKFWIIFWAIAISLLLGLLLLLEYKNKHYSKLIFFTKAIIKIAPIGEVSRKEIVGSLEMTDLLLKKEENNILIIFQDNNELRPGGGRMNTFGILNIKKGKVKLTKVQDIKAFDMKVSTEVVSPKAIKEQLGIPYLNLGNSNWSPDFRISAQEAEYFYNLEGGREKLDGVFVFSNKVLVTLLEVIGPIKIGEATDVYDSTNIVDRLEYQIGRDFQELNPQNSQDNYTEEKIFKEILSKIQLLDWNRKKILFTKVRKHLNERDAMLYFNDKILQRKIKRLGWSGEIKSLRQGDYLMMVDANLDSRKSDEVVNRKFEYVVDFRRKKPVADLKITYTHQGRVRDLRTDDYVTYLRVLAPIGSWLYDSNGLSGLEFIDFEETIGKKSFGVLHKVGLGKTKTVEFKYYLPKDLEFFNYRLFIQKQAGINKLVGKVKIINKMGNSKEYTVNSTRDVKIIVNNKKQSLVFR